MAKPSDSQKKNMMEIYEALIDMLNLSADLVDAANDVQGKMEGYAKVDNLDNLEAESKGHILQTLSDIRALGSSTRDLNEKISDRLNEMQKKFKIRHIKGQRKDKLIIKAPEDNLKR